MLEPSWIESSTLQPRFLEPIDKRRLARVRVTDRLQLQVETGTPGIVLRKVAEIDEELHGLVVAFRLPGGDQAFDLRPQLRFAAAGRLRQER